MTPELEYQLKFLISNPITEENKMSGALTKTVSLVQVTVISNRNQIKSDTFFMFSYYI